MKWRELFQADQPNDPDWPGPDEPARVTLWRDNLGGLMLGMQTRGREKIIILPVTRAEARDLADALREGLATP